MIDRPLSCPSSHYKIYVEQRKNVFIAFSFMNYNTVLCMLYVSLYASICVHRILLNLLRLSYMIVRIHKKKDKIQMSILFEWYYLAFKVNYVAIFFQ